MDEKSKTIFNTPCTPLQYGEEGIKEEVRKYNSERTYDIGDIRKTMKMILPKEYLERTDLTNAEKRVLAVILHTCRSDAYKKLGGYYPISNANLKTNAKIGSTGLTPITNHLKELGLIDFEQGEGRTKGKQRKATRYTILFDDKLIQKERFITDSIKPSEDSIKPSDNPTIKPRTSTSVDNQEVTPIEDGKSGAVYVKGDLNGEVEGNLKLKRNLEGYLKVEGNVDVNVEGNVKGNLEGNVDVNVDGNGEVNLDGNVEGNIEVKGGVSTNNNNIGNTNNNMKELLEKIYDKLTSIDINTRVKSEANAKLIEDKDKIIIELQGKNQELNELIKTKDEILDNLIGDYKELCGEYVKLIRRIGSYDNLKETQSKSNVETKTTTASSSTVDKIMTHQLGLASSNPIKDRAWKREQQKKVDTKTASKSNVEAKATTTSRQEQCHFPTLRENQLSKLKSFMETFKERISKATDKETLEAIEADFQEDGINFFNLNKEITKEDVTHYSEEISKAFQAKEKELAPKVATKTLTKVTVQEPSNEDGKRFHTEEKTAPKAETSEEKKETTAEPSTANSKSIEVSNVDTSDSKEEQKKLDDELDETASTKNSEEVEIPKDEEERQLQELKETLKPILENFNEVGTSEEHERILNEIRKAYTTNGYSQKVIQPFLDFALTYNFYAEKRDVVEAPHKETPSEEPRDEDYWNHTFTDEQVQEALSRLPKPNKRLKEDDDQEEVIDDDMPSDKEVASVVGGYQEENDAIF